MNELKTSGPGGEDTDAAQPAPTVLTKKAPAKEVTPVTTKAAKKKSGSAKAKAAKPVKAAKGGTNGTRHSIAEQRSKRKEFPVDAKVTYKGRRASAAGKSGVVVAHEKGDDVAGVFVKIGEERFVCSPYSLATK